MDQASLESCLADLALPATRYYPSIDSTNDEAWRWAESGAPHAALIVADEQTAGRGRFHNRWITSPGSGLAFSLILKTPPLQPQLVHLLSGLGGLAVCQALQTAYLLPAVVKWPNDVLLGVGKVAGILAEARWDGDHLQAAVIGIGINIAPESLDPQVLPPAMLDFPATSVEGAVGHPINRLELLHAILIGFFSWLPRLATSAFINIWESNLAYRGEWVELSSQYRSGSAGQSAGTPPDYTGRLIGLTMDGAIKLMTVEGDLVTAQVGELHLRPTDAPG
jgi:BirA family biotin operon repressor/biotin-[acetyl-CoA-carboxylase] ligase